MNKKTRQFLLTGPPGCGKTTLVEKVCGSLKKLNIPVYGFYTEELRVRGRRQGFDVVTLDGQQAVLARILEPGVRHNGPIVGQYAVNIPSFEQAVLPLLAKSETGVGIIDEIGKMELFSKDFSNKVKQIFCENRVLLVTIPVRPLPYVDRLKSEHPSAVVIEVNGNNRDTLEPQLTKMIVDAING
ncbi:hypothetical protein J6590_076982 [Homalodisca vitripennis]|nr:hypothetical protein J6590_076982 [Homalodisca vitripennis]